MREKNVDDGEYVDIYIKFKDGSVKETYCSNEFPITYNEMSEVFCEAFSVII